MPTTHEPIDPKAPPESAPNAAEEHPDETQQAGAPAVDAAVTAEALPGETPAQTRRRITELDPRQLAATKREAARRGQAAEQERLTAVAQKLGYKTLEEMLAAVPAAAGGEAPAPVEERTQKAGSRVKQLESEYALLQKKYARLEAAHKALTTDSGLREHAYRADVTDIDYALALLKKKVAGMAPAELKTFQPVEFLKGLRERHPYIFREEPKAAPAAPVDALPPVREVPVSTSPTARLRDDQIPTAPGPAAASRQEETPAIDVMALPPAEYQAYLKRKGIRDPRTMV